MQLFYSKTSPYTRKVLVMAHETGLADAITCIDITAHPIERNPELVARNPLGKIPALALDNGPTLFDSRVITGYLDTIHEGAPLIPSSIRTSALTLEALGDGICDAALLLRYEETLRPQDKRWHGWEDAQSAKITSAIDSLEREWMPFLNGPLTVGHIAIGCALGYLDFRFGDRDWRPGHDALAEWDKSFARRPSMTATAPA